MRPDAQDAAYLMARQHPLDHPTQWENRTGFGYDG